jgi:hypothetical protein
MGTKNLLATIKDHWGALEEFLRYIFRGKVGRAWSVSGKTLKSYESVRIEGAKLP